MHRIYRCGLVLPEIRDHFHVNSNDFHLRIQRFQIRKTMHLYYVEMYVLIMRLIYFMIMIF